ncbi:MAG: HNH endonuclease [Acidobacteria bacterium]|nr:HNH endonuclease [Acidobacteriota bacterium]
MAAAAASPTVSTVGNAELVLSQRWRLLSTFDAMSGLVLFAASAAYLAALLKRFLDPLHADASRRPAPRCAGASSYDLGLSLQAKPSYKNSRMPKKPDDHSTLREHFAWTYGTLAMVHAAVESGTHRYGPRHFMIRGRFRKGYLSGKMNMRPLHEDEKTKIAHATTCCYCGRAAKLTLDHLIPQLQGGPDAADNITYACQSCNSSKGSTDMVLWLVSKNRFPAILVHRRYLKLAHRWCEEANLMNTPWGDVPDEALLFRVNYFCR